MAQKARKRKTVGGTKSRPAAPSAVKKGASAAAQKSAMKKKAGTTVPSASKPSTTSARSVVPVKKAMPAKVAAPARKAAAPKRGASAARPVPVAKKAATAKKAALVKKDTLAKKAAPVTKTSPAPIAASKAKARVAPPAPVHTAIKPKTTFRSDKPLPRPVGRSGARLMVNPMIAKGLQPVSQDQIVASIQAKLARCIRVTDTDDAGMPEEALQARAVVREASAAVAVPEARHLTHGLDAPGIQQECTYYAACTYSPWL